MKKVLYFGCLDDQGHFLYEPSGATYQGTVGPWDPWKNLDGKLPPDDDPNQREGRCDLHHRDGWTAIACWDRSADHRLGSNSVFLAEGTHTFEEMLSLADEHFPQVVKRMRARFSFLLVTP